MSDREKWDRGVELLSEKYKRMSPAARERISGIAIAIRSCKSMLHQIVEGAGAAVFCAECAGECCRSGKNHVRGADVIVYLDSGRPLFHPNFDAPVCPYLDSCGCLMEPEFRPYCCITFICDQVEERLASHEREALLGLENRLRSLYAEMDSSLGEEFKTSLLSIGERTAERTEQY
jgi:hypothetical protein